RTPTAHNRKAHALPATPTKRDCSSDHPASSASTRLSPMRWLLPAILSLLTSTAITILIAWSCALWLEPTPLPTHTAPSELLRSFVPDQWRKRNLELHFLSDTRGRAPGIFREACEVVASEERDGQWIVVMLETLTVQRSGWPFTCLECARAVEEVNV